MQAAFAIFCAGFLCGVAFAAWRQVVYEAKIDAREAEHEEKLLAMIESQQPRSLYTELGEDER